MFNKSLGNTFFPIFIFKPPSIGQTFVEWRNEQAPNINR